MDTTQLVALVGAVSGAIGAIGGGICTWGVSAYLKIRADRREDVRLEEQREDVEDEKEEKTLRYIIGIQQGELTSLRTELKEMAANHREELRLLHNEHNDCEKRHAELKTELKVRMEMMDMRMGKVEQHVDPKLVVEVHDSEAIKGAVQETKAAIRDGVHDVVDRLSGKILKEQADQAGS